MDFGQVIAGLKQGKRFARKGWNGKRMWIALQPGSVIAPEQARGGAAKGRAEEGASEIAILPHIDMRAADGSIVVGWLASQTDMLAEDWEEFVYRPETTVARFRKRPVEIEAMRYSYPASHEMRVWMGAALGEERKTRSFGSRGEMTLMNADYSHIVRDGDWIIKGVAGEFYPCKADMFATIYEPVESR